jgi:iron(III) transport system permease protein
MNRIESGAAPVTQRETAEPDRRPFFRSRGVLPNVLVVVTFAVLILFIVVPIIFIFYGSTRSDLPGAPDAKFTLSAIRTVFTTKTYLKSLVDTLGLSLLVSAIAVSVGSLFAWILTRTDILMKKFLELVVLAPLFLSPLVSALAWVTLAAPRSGVMNVTAKTLFGLSGIINITSLPGIIFVMSLSFIPYGYLFTSSAFKNIDATFEEAAYLAGAGLLRTFLRITWPVARPAVLSAFFLVAVLSAGMFSIPAVLDANLPFIPLAVRVERAIDLSPANYAVAAAIGIEMMLIAIIGLYFYLQSVRSVRRFVTVTGKLTRPRVVSLGRLKAPSAVLFFLYALLSIVLPYFALLLTAFTPYAITDLSKVTLSTKSFVNVITSTNTLSALKNTVEIGLLAPTVCVIFAFVVSYGTSQSESVYSRLANYVATVPVAIPGIVFGTGMVWAYITTPLYATIWILLLAFVAHYLPYAYRLASAAAAQIDRTLPEAARVSGASRARAWATVTLPLSRPALLAAWILVFVFVVREVDVVIVLASPGTNLLSVATFDAEQYGVLQTAAVLGLLQTAILLGGIIVARYVFRTKLRDVGL